MNEEERLRKEELIRQEMETPLTKNVIRQGEIFGFKQRNIIEAIISILFLLIVLFVIPFTTIVRVVVFIIWGTGLVILNLHGIKNRSVSEILIDEIRFQARKRRMHLRGPEYERQSGLAATNNESNKSDAEIILEFFKKKIEEFVDEYADEESDS